MLLIVESLQNNISLDYVEGFCPGTVQTVDNKLWNDQQI